MSYPKPDDLLTCPYNKAHQVERSRIQFHLEKCRKQHPNEQKIKCPFDATHVINRAELDACELEVAMTLSLANRRARAPTQRAAAPSEIMLGFV
ncbi:Gametocyte-specific factor 1 [Eumeta japonica]|uniref:Gametocyte-specific factor 1 n=1 Tax=Eumeta variegata TaxID=151549 RepID=A0A4C1VL37_EUMVA|nr:Gametocyte-specific factor 1 [Eumeta japonica]